jgi:hypothetical protein
MQFSGNNQVLASVPGSSILSFLGDLRNPLLDIAAANKMIIFALVQKI